MPTIWALARQRQAELQPKGARPTKIRLARWLKACAPTFEAFCARCKIVDKDGHLVPFRPNRIQRRRAEAWTRRDIVLKARQQGMTTWELLRDLYHFLTRPHANVMILCQTAQDHKALDDIATKFERIVRALEADGVVFPWRGAKSATYWELETGAILTIAEAGASAAAASKKGRAGTISRLHCTELAYWEYAGQTWNAILECIPVGGDSEIVIESTPNGSAPDVAKDKRDLKNATGGSLFHWFYTDAKSGANSYRAHFFEWWLTEEYEAPLPANDNGEPLPFVAEGEEEEWLVAHGVLPAQLQWRRLKLQEKDLDTFAQEYPKDDVTCFLLSGRPFFDKDAIARLLLHAKAPIETTKLKRTGEDGELRIWVRAKHGESYIISADTSEGVGGDPAAAHVYEVKTGLHCATLDGQFKPWNLARRLAELGKVYATHLKRGIVLALIAVERNNHGGTVLRSLEAEQFYPNIFFDSDGRPGWVTSNPSRTAGLDTLEEAVRLGHWKTFDKAMLAEMRTFVVNDRGRPEAARGAHDEHPLTAMIGWDVLCRTGTRRSLGAIEGV